MPIYKTKSGYKIKNTKGISKTRTQSTGSGRTSSSGGLGRIHLDYSESYTGSTTPTLDATLDSTIVDATPTTNYLKHYRRSRICGSITGV